MPREKECDTPQVACDDVTLLPGKNSELSRCQAPRFDRLEIAVMKNSLCERLLSYPDFFNQLIDFHHGSDSMIRASGYVCPRDAGAACRRAPNCLGFVQRRRPTPN